MRHLTAIVTLLLIFLNNCDNGFGYISTNTTNFKWWEYRVYKTSTNIKVSSEDPVYINNTIFNKIDLLTFKVEKCFRTSFNRSWWRVHIPKNWYWSQCSHYRQQFPTFVPCEICREKGLDVKEKCCNDAGLSIGEPTEECPCPCNHTAVIQDNAIIITTPNLELYHYRLATLALASNSFSNNLWGNSELLACLDATNI